MVFGNGTKLKEKLKGVGETVGERVKESAGTVGERIEKIREERRERKRIYKEEYEAHKESAIRERARADVKRKFGKDAKSRKRSIAEDILGIGEAVTTGKRRRYTSAFIGGLSDYDQAGMYQDWGFGSPPRKLRKKRKKAKQRQIVILSNSRIPTISASRTARKGRRRKYAQPYRIL